jgi:hypothetical protein
MECTCQGYPTAMGRTCIPGSDQPDQTHPQRSPDLLKPRDPPKDTLASQGTGGGGGNVSTTILFLFIPGLLNEALYRMLS